MTNYNEKKTLTQVLVMILKSFKKFFNDNIMISKDLKRTL